MMPEITRSLGLLALFSMGAYLAILLAKSVLVARVVARQRRFLASTEGVFDTANYSLTIAQPILSGDPRLAERLKTCTSLVPPHVKFVWLVDYDDSAARSIALQIGAECPNTTVLLCDEAPKCTNPKSWKLQKALEKCESEFFCVLDDDTVITAQTLRDAGRHLSTCDLYTGLPYYEDDGSIWARLLAHFVNNNSALTYLPLLNFGAPLSINGMFYIVRTREWKALGGFSTLMHQLCDDYAVRCLASAHNWRVVQGISPQYVGTTVSNMHHYVSIQHRWNLFALIFLKEQPFFLECVLFFLLVLPPALLWCSLVAIFLGRQLLVFALVFLVIRHAVVNALHRFTFSSSAQLSVKLSLLAELLQPFHGLHALFVRTIRWRSRTIRVISNSSFRILDEGPR